MKKLTEEEIKFIKDTGWTPTLHQMDYAECELKHTLFPTLNRGEAIYEFRKAARNLGVNILNLYNKCIADQDAISLEYEATYLLYTFFDANTLLDMDTSWALNWLKDFKYYLGFRKWSEDLVESEINEALEIHAGSRKLYMESDGYIWNKPEKIS